MVGDIFQPTHLLFVLVVALLVLGPKRLPEVGRTLGAGIRDFRQALSGDASDRSEHSDSSEAELSPQWDPAEDHTEWPEEAVGPTSFDEPVEAASAEPARTADEPATTTSVTSDPANGAHADGGGADATAAGTPFSDAGTSSGEGTAAAGSVSAPAVGTTSAGDLAASEHELARQSEHELGRQSERELGRQSERAHQPGESGRSSEQTDSRD
jgi:sec-independent protein translocase protein TatA